MSSDALEAHWLEAHRYLRNPDGTRRLHVFRGKPIGQTAMLMAYYRPHSSPAAGEAARFFLGADWEPWGGAGRG